MHNFMDTFITELFSTNYDYPQNKISMWRNKSEGSKWRWILKDLDYTGFHKPVTYNMFDYMFQTGEPESDEYYDSTYDGNIAICQQLYKKMMSFSEFREMFINHFVVYLGDFLRPSITKKTIMEMVCQIRDEVVPTYSVYHDMGTLEHFDESINEIVDFWEKRPKAIYDQLSHFFYPWGDYFCYDRK